MFTKITGILKLNMYFFLLMNFKHSDTNTCSFSDISDSGIPTKPKELIHQDLYYSFERGQTAVLTCNVQSVPPPAFR